LVSLAVLSLLAVGGFTSVAAALQSTSAHYGVDETSFGSGGLLCDVTQGDGSAHYCASQTLGENAAGNSASANYQIQAGNSETDRQPYIEFVVDNTNINLGKLTSGTTAYATATFHVKTYLADGYTVVNASDGPQNGSYSMHTLSTPTASNPNAEQFGINLVANSTACTTPAPANFGADPVQQPDSSFASGQVGSDYDTCGLFEYKKGDVVAYSNASTSQTDYTVSYIFNITPITPGGTYTMNHVLVATSTF